MPSVETNLNPYIQRLYALAVQKRWREDDRHTVTRSRPERRAIILEHISRILVISQNRVPNVQDEGAINAAAHDAFLNDPVFHALAFALEDYISNLIDAA